ncbi:hypothetical protein N0V82_002844 [Gnomoniopsis sp. IMI 355080]|nr:hypothetical protein N0V82_002844 [Gnomoniopsis sp. IMI 355080]
MSDDIYGATPQHTGVTQSNAPHSSHGHGSELDTTSLLEANTDDGYEKPPALPPRRPSILSEQAPPINPNQPLTFYRSKDYVMAFMIPLPQPIRADGQRVDVPQRYMLYVPPAPDLLKPPPSSNIKERKRDKCVRKWQTEVRKAKTQHRPVASFKGFYHATVRGAGYCLALIQRSELTFLARLPRKTLRELCFVHPITERTEGSRKFELVKEEFRRNKHVAKRDFWIGAVLLPFAEGLDIAIPIGGGFSEVTLVWMIVTGSAWKTSSGMLQRLNFTDVIPNRRIQDGLEDDYRNGNANEDISEGAEASADQVDHGRSKTSRWKKEKENRPPVETTFHPSAFLDKLSHYIRATCHACDPEIFPDVGQPSTEVDVLRSIGWAPEERESEDPDGDVAWQIQKTTDDLKVVVTKAAKTWGKFCATYVVDPEKALRQEEKARMKNLEREEKEKMKKTKREAKEK